jgi:Phosphotransferase enzyme family
MQLAGRNQILVVGAASFDTTEFERRRLGLKVLAPGEALAHFNAAKAVMVVDHAGKFALIKESFAGLFLQAEDHGLAQVIIVHSLSDLAQVDALRKKDFPLSNSKIFRIDELWGAAEFIARHDVGPPAGSVKIEPESLKLHDDAKLLLRRSFTDCDRILLEPLPGGKASMFVYRVHAWLLPEWCIAGPQPLPFFVKIADPNSIEVEKTNYRIYAEHFIPFDLRPNIEHRRCVQTRSYAALAGDFVGDAVGLRKYLKMGLGMGVLFSLFETSLRGFRLQPFATNQKPREGVLESFVKGRIKANEIDPRIADHARNFHLTSRPSDMENAICKEAEKLTCFWGPCHGDLHSGNVMVRGGDAILIDFGSAGDGPLTADPAALEASLMFGTDDDDKPNSFNEWRAFADQVYDGDIQSLHPVALSEGHPGPFSWLRRSIRELRHILLGCNVKEREAKIVLAAYLMRYARLGKDALDRGDGVAFDRHAYALVVAERIIRGLANSSPSNGGH